MTSTAVLETPMKAHIAALLAACMASACSAVPDAPAPSAAAGEVREVAFACDGGQSLAVRFHPDERAVLLRNGEEIELRQQVSGSGFIYGNGPTTIRGKGEDLTVEIGRMVPIRCRAA